MMSEKDAVISSFQKLINQQQQTLENLEKKVKNLEEEVKIEEKCFKCHLCDFKSEFEKGLKTHINRKHKTENKKEESRKFPRVCEFCEKEIKSSKELKTHMKNHTYRYVKYQCNECEFMAADSVDMSVHVGKAHGENYECGLCEYIAEDFENLEMHLFTCEVYKCDRCDPKFKTLAEMKTHIENTHGDLSDEWGKVEHIKQSRGNKYEFSITPHKYSEIFSETGLKKKSI